MDDMAMDNLVATIKTCIVVYLTPQKKFISKFCEGDLIFT